MMALGLMKGLRYGLLQDLSCWIIRLKGSKAGREGLVLTYCQFFSMYCDPKPP